jgi:hypothetical protein
VREPEDQQVAKVAARISPGDFSPAAVAAITEVATIVP